MSEGKRVSLTSIGPKKSKFTPNNTKCLRLNLTLCEPNKEWCPVFDYEALVKSEQEKLDAEKKKKAPVNGTDPFEDDDKDVKKIAKHYEEKYGINDRRYTYAELGEGYDENDSFIDNTEICEEQLLDEGYKKYEGYYVNKDKFNSNGSSERRSSDDTDNRQKRRRKNRIVSETESDSESESSCSKKPMLDKKQFGGSVTTNGVKAALSDLSQSSSMHASSGTLGGDSKSEESQQTFNNQIKKDCLDQKVNSLS